MSCAPNILIQKKKNLTAFPRNLNVFFSPHFFHFILDLSIEQHENAQKILPTLLCCVVVAFVRFGFFSRFFLCVFFLSFTGEKKCISILTSIRLPQKQNLSLNGPSARVHPCRSLRQPEDENNELSVERNYV